MAENSKIEWTDHTLNLWWGCAKVHTGCKNCYAEYLSETRYGNGVWGEKTPRKRIKSAFLNLAKWQKAAADEGVMRKVFCGSMMDIFEESKDLMNPKDEYLRTGNLRHELFYRIDQGKYPNLIFQMLTKRPENIYKMVPEKWHEEPPSNVWIGTSCSDQATFDMYSYRLEEWAGNRFLSVEPQIGPIVIHNPNLIDVDWIIQGGESGNKKRPFELYWAEHMKEVCEQRGIPYFFKQIDKIQEIPEDLMIRQFPECMGALANV